ncbi:MAG: glycosyltransferase family 39 protein [Planctomycetaceae bacterium]|nr:glycosyltransferase family 39 protein [Planctomycetaceae bacterium]
MTSACGASASLPRWTARWKWAAAAILLLDLVKHAALFAVGQAQPWGDSTLYWRMGGEVAAGDWWLANDPVAFRTPGYPWYLGLCREAFGTHGLIAAVAGQHLCIVLTSVATAALAWSISRSRGWTLLAWGMCAGSTARPLYANWLLTESLATLLLTLALLLISLACQCGCWKRLALAGFVLGMGVLVRPSVIAAFPALVFAGLWLSQSTVGSPWRRATLLAAGPLVLGGVLLPWCLRNQLLFDRMTLCAFTGRELWTAHFSPWPGGGLALPRSGAAGEVYERVGTRALDWRHQWSVSGALTDSGLNDAQTDALMERVAWQAIAAQPGRAAFRTLARCITFWYCWEWEVETTQDPLPERANGFYANQFRWSCPTLQPRVLSLLRRTPERWYVTSVAMSVAAWLGVLLLWTRRETRPFGVGLALILSTSTGLTAALEIPLYRYRCVLEPLMITAAVCGGGLYLQSLSAFRKYHGAGRGNH